MINCILEMPKPTIKKALYILRKYNSIDHDKFSNDLISNMHVIKNSKYDNVSDLLDDYNQACCEVLDIHAPATNRSKGVNHHPCWYGKSIEWCSQGMSPLQKAMEEIQIGNPLSGISCFEENS